MNYNVKRIIARENSKTATRKAIVSNGMLPERISFKWNGTICENTKATRKEQFQMECDYVLPQVIWDASSFLSNSYCFQQNDVYGGNT